MPARRHTGQQANRHAQQHACDPAALTTNQSCPPREVSDVDSAIEATERLHEQRRIRRAMAVSAARGRRVPSASPTRRLAAGSRQQQRISMGNGRQLLAVAARIHPAQRNISRNAGHLDAVDKDRDTSAVAVLTTGNAAAAGNAHAQAAACPETSKLPTRQKLVPDIAAAQQAPEPGTAAAQQATEAGTAAVQLVTEADNWPPVAHAPAMAPRPPAHRAGKKHRNAAAPDMAHVEAAAAAELDIAAPAVTEPACGQPEAAPVPATCNKPVAPAPQQAAAAGTHGHQHSTLPSHTASVPRRSSAGGGNGARPKSKASRNREAQEDPVTAKPDIHIYDAGAETPEVSKSWSRAPGGPINRALGRSGQHQKPQVVNHKQPVPGDVTAAAVQGRRVHRPEVVHPAGTAAPGPEVKYPPTNHAGAPDVEFAAAAPPPPGNASGAVSFEPWCSRGAARQQQKEQPEGVNGTPTAAYDMPPIILPNRVGAQPAHEPNPAGQVPAYHNPHANLHPYASPPAPMNSYNNNINAYADMNPYRNPNVFYMLGHAPSGASAMGFVPMPAVQAHPPAGAMPAMMPRQEMYVVAAANNPLQAPAPMGHPGHMPPPAAAAPRPARPFYDDFGGQAHGHVRPPPPPRR